MFTFHQDRSPTLISLFLYLPWPVQGRRDPVLLQSLTRLFFLFYLRPFILGRKTKGEAKLAIVFPLIGHTLIKETAYTDLKFNQSHPWISWISTSQILTISSKLNNTFVEVFLTLTSSVKKVKTIDIPVLRVIFKCHESWRLKKQ